jgi:hypothetical protein
MVPARNKRLLQDTGWHVAPINKGSTRLQARANSSAPGIRRKQLLHRLVTKAAPHESVAALTRRPTQQPVEVQCFNTGRVVRVKSEAETAADTKSEKGERRAARKARKAAKAMVMQRRRERAAAAMAEMDAKRLHHWD